MIDIFSRNFNIKVLFFILSNLLSFKIRGRHSTTAYSLCVLYNTIGIFAIKIVKNIQIIPISFIK